MASRTLICALVIAGFVVEREHAFGQVGQSARSSSPTLTASSVEMPQQTVRSGELKLKHPSFTFVRVQYASDRPVGSPITAGPIRGRTTNTADRFWSVDFPQSDMNLAARFQQVTGVTTGAEPKVLRLTDAEVTSYPFLYLVEGGRLRLSEAEVPKLREYLLGGGFLMIDDFWGEADWQNLVAQFKQVFPDRQPTELAIDHPIFHSFYDFKEKPQVFGVHPFLAQRAGSVIPEATQPARYLGITNDTGRLMVLFCHNNDLGDGWEREEIDAQYALEHSQKRAYPMGINIVVYALSQSNK
jgi:hypothetical protein